MVKLILKKSHEIDVQRGYECCCVCLDTAYGTNCYDNNWYYFDDSSVSSSTAESAVVSYVLDLSNIGSL